MQGSDYAVGEKAIQFFFFFFFFDSYCSIRCISRTRGGVKPRSADGDPLRRLGVSGGEEGARFGPSLMPGGTGGGMDALMRDVLEAIAAKTDAGPCVTHVGPGGAGHFVKMVHNGIEYADMQLIAET